MRATYRPSLAAVSIVYDAPFASAVTVFAAGFVPLTPVLTKLAIMPASSKVIPGVVP